jgi:hypothetical protein
MSWWESVSVSFSSTGKEVSPSNTQWKHRRKGMVEEMGATI